MKHRALALLLSAGLLLALPGCGGNDSGTDTPTDSPALTDTPAPESTPPAASDLPETELPEETAPGLRRRHRRKPPT